MATGTVTYVIVCATTAEYNAWKVGLAAAQLAKPGMTVSMKQSQRTFTVTETVVPMPPNAGS